jgi:hypothetical protein
MSSLELPKNIANLEQFKFKKFGKSALSYYKLNE